MIKLEPKQLKDVTPTEMRNAHLIALLLLTAKLLGTASKAATGPRDLSVGQPLVTAIASFLQDSVGTYGDGVRLEKDTLALAKELGFEVEQRIMSQVAHA